MRAIVLAIVALILSASAASAATVEKWGAGPDNFNEPLNYKKSKVTWSVNSPKKTLTVTITLVGATPNKFYQSTIVFFCSTFPATFGQFGNDIVGGGACVPITRQGVTKTLAAVELGIVTTDLHGNGTFTVVIGPVASGTYPLEFVARDGAGCGLIGGAGNGPDCNIDFQSPGPIWGDATTITIP